MRFEIFETFSDNVVLALLVTCILISIDIVHSIAVYFINKSKHNEVWFSKDAPFRYIDPFEFRVTYGISRTSLMFYILVMIVSLADWYFIGEGFNFAYAFIYGSINIFFKTKEMFFDNKVWFVPKEYGNAFAEVYSHTGRYFGILSMGIWSSLTHYPNAKIETRHYGYREVKVGNYTLKFNKVPGLESYTDIVIDKIEEAERLGKSVVDAALFRQPFFDPIYPLTVLYNDELSKLLKVNDINKTDRNVLVAGVLSVINESDKGFFKQAKVNEFLISKKAELEQLLHASRILLSPEASALMTIKPIQVKDLLRSWLKFFGHYDIILMNDGVMDREDFLSALKHSIDLGVEFISSIRGILGEDIKDIDTLRRKVLEELRANQDSVQTNNYKRVVETINKIIDDNFISNK